MNDQIKKNTNKGIAFAVVGFLLIGGALVLIPRLVDEKVKSIAGAADKQGGGSAAAVESGQQPGQTHVAQNAPAPGAQASNTVGEKTLDAASSSSSAATPPTTTAKSEGPWELTLEDKYEPDEASQKILTTLVEQIKQNGTWELKVVGINNINKSSKLAQMGASRIANIIVRDAQINPNRLEIAAEQQPDLDNIRVVISVQGGAQ